MWLLGVLLEDDHRLFLITLPTTVDELNRLMQSEPAAKEMMYNLIARLSGDLAAFTEGLRQVDLYQTWAQTFEDLMVDKKKIWHSGRICRTHVNLEWSIEGDRRA